MKGNKFMGFFDLFRQKNKITISNANWQIGDIISFGKYPNINSEKFEDLRWKVLDKKGDKLLLITQDCIDGKLFDDTGMSAKWSNCSLRKWLNNDFLHTAFDTKEIAKIVLTSIDSEQRFFDKTISQIDSTQDKVFILSKDEAFKYFTSDLLRQSKVTNYAINRGADYDVIEHRGRWWLRSSCVGCVDCVLFLGGISEFGYPANDEDGSIRPAVWITI